MCTTVRPNNVILMVLACAATLVASGCSNAKTSESEKDFVARMMPHHALGMQLMDEAMLHSSDVRLRRVVFEMNNYHHSEMTTLKNWQEKWDVTESQSFPGNLDHQAVERLEALTGVSHDTWWLHLMIIHHEGALEIADDAINLAQEPDVMEMARVVRTVQETQLDSMHQLLEELCQEIVRSPGCARSEDESLYRENASGHVG
jgi:uncharacterized protein (DUF305 family)